MLTTYPACFFKEKDGYSVFFPDLEGCYTSGSTRDEAIYMASDALALYAFSENLSGNQLPPASSCQDISPEVLLKEYNIDDCSECFTNYITVDVDDYMRRHARSVKKTLSIPEWLNDLAVAAGINFSQELQSALRQKLNV